MRLQIDATDCEAAGTVWPVQPVNTLSSLALVAVGAVVAGVAATGAAGVPAGDRKVLVGYGAAVSSAGVGSFAYHGWATAPARFAHDLTILVVLGALIGGTALRRAGGVRLRAAWLPVAATLAVGAPVLALAPSSATTLVALMLVALVGAELVARRAPTSPHARVWRRVAWALAACGVLTYLAGRTASPFCDPASAWQWHAAWHVLIALALGAWAVAAGATRR